MQMMRILEIWIIGIHDNLVFLDDPIITKNSTTIMDRGRKAMPVQNKACMERYIQKCQERHKQKVRPSVFLVNWFPTEFSPLHIQLRDMKSSIDNKCPRAASHLKTKAKKNALMEDRFAQIETENRLLLERMSHIMRVSDYWYIEYTSEYLIAVIL